LKRRGWKVDETRDEEKWASNSRGMSSRKEKKWKA
jgi:hypothetical protein